MINRFPRYAACFLAIAGGSPSGPLFLVWATDNAAPETVRAVTTAMIPGLGTIGAVIAYVSLHISERDSETTLDSVWTYLPADAPN